MCGIAGVISNNLSYDQISQCLVKANSIQRHRGPDATGIYIHEKTTQMVGLAHQRLSVIDLSDSANQPMAAYDGQGYIVYNGEVYNYLELREELQCAGYSFKSNSDTEVVITAIRHWGIENALNRFNGMWAFAYLDLTEKTVYLARDRFGVKPLYYFHDSIGLFFASEIKTILEISKKRFSLDYQIIGEYLDQSLAESSNNTFFQGVYKIPAGSYAEINLTNEQRQIKFQKYYQLDEHLEYTYIEFNDLVQRIRESFFDAVKIRLRSDVPIGVLLSGGIDSSSIAAVIHPKEDIKLLSAVSDDKKFDESRFIDIVAHHLNRPVYKVNLDFQHNQMIKLLERVCWYNDEPVGSFSNVAHYLLMKKAEEIGVTVVLTGQGADELLCGYRKYLGFYLQEMFRNNDYIGGLRNILKFSLNGTVINQFSLAEAKRYLPEILRPNISSILGEALDDYKPQFLGLQKTISVTQRQILDIYRFSIPVLTHYEDRMSMAWSREVRVPFLDYRLVELLVGLPTSLKLNEGWTKYIFRKALEPYLPYQIIWRKDKQGFINPQSEWLRDSLKQEVMNYFQADSLIFKYRLVKRTQLLELYEQYCKQKTNRGKIWFKDIFNPLALEIWLRQNERYIV